MDSDVSAHAAATNRHNRYMVIGKKQRYIEVLQCSGEDMSLVLTGGLAPPPPPPSAAANTAPVKSPAGMLPIPTSLTAAAAGLPGAAAAASLPQFSLYNEQIPHHLSPLLYPAGGAAAGVSSLLLNGLLPPAQTLPTSAAAIPGMEQLLLPQQQLQQQLLMLPPTQPRFHLPPAAQQLQAAPQFLIPPPQIPSALRPSLSLAAPQIHLSFPPPISAATGGAAPPALSTHPAKRTHDQAFQNPVLDSVPSKRPPVLYTPISTAGGSVTPGLLPAPTLPSQTF